MVKMYLIVKYRKIFRNNQNYFKIQLLWILISEIMNVEYNICIQYAYNIINAILNKLSFTGTFILLIFQAQVVMRFYIL